MFRILIFILTLTACSSVKSTIFKSTINLEGKWRLIEFNNNEIKSNSENLILNIQHNNEIYFKGICNEINGNWKILSNSKINFINLAITEQVCDTIYYDNSIFEIFNQQYNSKILHDTLYFYKTKMNPVCKWVKVKE